MLIQPAPEVLRHWHAKEIYILIPGGWTMLLPEYRVDDEFITDYVRQFMSFGMSMGKARDAVLQGIRSHAEAGFRHSLLSSVTYFGKLYSKMYPERMEAAGKRKKTFLLRGYRPELMQTVHVPGMRLGETNKAARNLLMEMTA